MAETLLSPKVKFWKDEIDLYERTFEKWTKRGKRIYKRYKDVRTPREDAVTRFNVLWSNVQTRLPALYARDPKPEVERRFKDKDPIGRVVAEIIERSLDYTVQHCNPFGRIIRQAVLDYELPGRGTVWIRYVPHFAPKEAEAQEAGNPGPTTSQQGVEPEETRGSGETDEEQETESESERLNYEETILDYVYWEDFGHTWARSWEEIRGVWRRIYLTREEGLERFGKAFRTVPLDWNPKNLSDAKVGQEQKKAVIYEIWDKQAREVIWISKNHPTALDEKDDPLNLENFFPLPPPLYANLSNDELIPNPNFTYYQDQANEIDELSTRIASIGKALKVAGIYDASAEGIDRLLAEGVENQLIPISGWSALMQKGGLKGAIELLPLKDIAEALASLREQRQMMIDDVHEITGLSDIIRGNSEPNETATAQQIKGQFASLRISDAQSEVQRYCRDIMRIMAELIADYDIETLKQISGVKLLTNAEKAQLSALLHAVPQMPPGVPRGTTGPAPAGSSMPMSSMPPMGAAPTGAGMPGPSPGAQPSSSPSGPPPGASPGAGIDPQKLALLKEPSWEDIEVLLKNPVLREFRIDVETDSTIRIDEESDRRARMEFLDAVSKMIMEAANVPHALIPAAGELIMFGIRGFKVARNLEHAFEEAIDQLKDQPPPPDPEMAKIQAQVQGDAQVAQIKAQADTQIAGHKAQFDAQMEQAKQEMQARGDQARNQMELQRSASETQMKTEHEAQLAQLKAQHEQVMEGARIQKDKEIAAAKNATDLQIAEMKMRHEAEQKAADRQHEGQITSLTQSHEQKMAEHQGKHEAGMERLKGQNAEHLQDKKASTDEKLTKLKPKAEADAANEKESEHPHVKAIEKLTEALKEARKPRKVKRDEQGKIVEVH